LTGYVAETLLNTAASGISPSAISPVRTERCVGEQLVLHLLRLSERENPASASNPIDHRRTHVGIVQLCLAHGGRSVHVSPDASAAPRSRRISTSVLTKRTGSAQTA
jgi:hypothetical protein